MIDIPIELWKYLEGIDNRALLVLLGSYSTLKAVIVRDYNRRREEIAKELAEAEKRYDKSKERALRSVERETETQLEDIYSAGYVAMSGIVNDLHHRGQQHFHYHVESGEFRRSLSGFLPEFKKELKNITFKKLLSAVNDRINDDIERYTRDEWEEYCANLAKDMRSVLRTDLGKRLGTSELLDELFEGVFKFELFYESAQRIIKCARDYEEYLW